MTAFRERKYPHNKGAVTPRTTRIMGKFTIDREGCWEWHGAKYSDGYGMFSEKNAGTGDKMKQHRAHRLVYELLVGPVPEGLVLDHLCRNTLCVNPHHLEPVTPRENQRRGMAGELKTSCNYGHPYDEANTRIAVGGGRQCRECDKLNARARRREARL